MCVGIVCSSGGRGWGLGERVRDAEFVVIICQGRMFWRGGGAAFPDFGLLMD